MRKPTAPNHGRVASGRLGSQARLVNLPRQDYQVLLVHHSVARLGLHRCLRVRSGRTVRGRCPIFFAIGDEIFTPPLGGTILPGITRDSVITLLRDSGYRVREAPITIENVFKSFRAGELRECFGTGTAATVSHVRRIRHQNETIELPPVEERKIGTAIKERLLAIMTGRAPDSHGWVERL